MNEIEIEIGNGVSLCAMTGYDGYKEVIVFLKKDGIIWQDIALVSPDYHYRDRVGGADDVVYNPELYLVRVWGDPNNEDYTNRFDIDIYKEEE